MRGTTVRSSLPLPRNWPRRVRSGVVQAIALAQFSLSHARAWATHSRSPALRRRAEADRLEQEVALLREEIRIKDARMEEIPGPKFTPRNSAFDPGVRPFRIGQ